MTKWILFQSSWMVGNQHSEASYYLAFYRYLLVIVAFYTLSYITTLPLPNSRMWIVTLLTLVGFLLLYCLMMYAVCSFIYWHFAELPYYFRDNIYENITARGPWTFLLHPMTFYFHFEQLGLALLPALTIKVFRLTLQTRLKSLKLEKSNLELELNFLRSQINPHFLFNTLNSLYALIEEKDAVAASIIASLSNMMRYALYESNAPEVEAGKELDFIKGYVDIQNVRHSNRLHVELGFDPEVYYKKVPPLILVTFLENAVKHGLDKTRQKSYIKISAYMENEQFCFFILNSKPRQKVGSNPGHGGIGIKNTQRRLNILYPDRHVLNIQETEDEYSVLLKIW
ncbi:sensor histidine kinase [Deminuibacter soli]|uniref:Signal transduction histidine kinase internal region domain-containing protein n=1 Tax=Deminuibacter soli TaxID=2291815 RepID=A0A3E1NRH3_9BACT|nr:histidine kinase [Deminuibacter soli]RFM30531.1 hypothetical protein DXN05_06140 [Deminuibacter soli]